MAELHTGEAISSNHPSSSSLWSNCRPDIQRRINALLNDQAEYFRLRVQFHRQLHDLQYAYSSQFESVLEKRRQIIAGSTLPTEIENRSEQFSQSNQETGLSNFWQIVLTNVNSYEYPVQTRDAFCLNYLLDVRCILSPPNAQRTGFSLEFHFHPSNPYFIETLLTKHYSIRLELDASSPYRSYDGPEVDHCQGCLITWNADYDLTIEKRTRRIRHRTTGRIRSLEIEQARRSFFDFFSPPVIPSGGIEEMTDDDQLRLEGDIQLGLLLKQRVLPRAILYYTGDFGPTFEEENESDSF